MLVINERAAVPRSEQRVLDWMRTWKGQYIIVGLAISGCTVPGRNGGGDAREADLVVVTPRAVLVIEVKGTVPDATSGVLSVEASGRWRLSGFDGDPIRVRDNDTSPFEQVTDNVANLRDLVHEHQGAAYVDGLIVVVPPWESTVTLEVESGRHGCGVVLGSTPGELRAWLHRTSNRKLLWTAEAVHALLTDLRLDHLLTVEDLLAEGFPSATGRRAAPRARAEAEVDPDAPRPEPAAVAAAYPDHLSRSLRQRAAESADVDAEDAAAFAGPPLPVSRAESSDRVWDDHRDSEFAGWAGAAYPDDVAVAAPEPFVPAAREADSPRVSEPELPAAIVSYVESGADVPQANSDEWQYGSPGAVGIRLDPLSHANTDMDTPNQSALVPALVVAESANAIAPVSGDPATVGPPLVPETPDAADGYAYVTGAALPRAASGDHVSDRPARPAPAIPGRAAMSSEPVAPDHSAMPGQPVASGRPTVPGHAATPGYPATPDDTPRAESPRAATVLRADSGDGGPYGSSLPVDSGDIPITPPGHTDSGDEARRAESAVADLSPDQRRRAPESGGQRPYHPPTHRPDHEIPWIAPDTDVDPPRSAAPPYVRPPWITPEDDVHPAREDHPDHRDDRQSLTVVPEPELPHHTSYGEDEPWSTDHDAAYPPAAHSQSSFTDRWSSWIEPGADAPYAPPTPLRRQPPPSTDAARALRRSAPPSVDPAHAPGTVRRSTQPFDAADAPRALRGSPPPDVAYVPRALRRSPSPHVDAADSPRALRRLAPPPDDAPRTLRRLVPPSAVEPEAPARPEWMTAVRERITLPGGFPPKVNVSGHLPQQLAAIAVIACAIGAVWILASACSTTYRDAVHRPETGNSEQVDPMNVEKARPAPITTLPICFPLPTSC